MNLRATHLLAVMVLSACAGPRYPQRYAPPRSMPVTNAPAPNAPAPGAGANGPNAKGSGAKAQAAKRKPYELAVMPLEDDELFRDERHQLRALLASKLAAQSQDYRVLRLAEVDKQLLPVTQDGTRCAYDEADASSWIRRKGWAYTDVTHVLGTRQSPEQLWVDILRNRKTLLQFKAPYGGKHTRAQRYARAFAALKLDAETGALMGVLGDLMAQRRDATNKDGSLAWCERSADFFSKCDAGGERWSDRVKALTACYADEDQARDTLLLDPAQKRCEPANLRDLDSRRAKRGQCLCRALASSAGMSAARKSGRRHLGFWYQAPAVKDRPRPQLRLLDTTTNLDNRSSWYSPPKLSSGKRPRTVFRLAVDNLDSLAVNLARCDAKPGSMAHLTLKLNANGSVNEITSDHLHPAQAALASCIQQAGRRGRFNCTNGSEKLGARLRIVANWPAEAPK